MTRRAPRQQFLQRAKRVLAAVVRQAGFPKRSWANGAPAGLLVMACDLAHFCRRFSGHYLKWRSAGTNQSPIISCDDLRSETGRPRIS